FSPTVKSRGPTIDTRPAGRTKPDLAAPGQGIMAPKSGARGGNCCDCCYDFYVAMSGTSMAAPHVAGIVALLFEAEPTLTWDAVRSRLRSSCDPPDPVTGPTLPDATWGAGIVNAKKALGIPDVVVSDGSAVTAASPAEHRVAGRHAAGAPAVLAGLRGGALAGPFAELRARVLASPQGQQA
ncbi:MAG TPA: S8 family serine peptidase, partial [Actinotalea sp.]|nr:S8 family serine peptidase [Actinotalea sp.]